MTAYTAYRAPKTWQRSLDLPAPPYRDHWFTGEDQVPLFGQVALPPSSALPAPALPSSPSPPLPSRGTLIATYGIVGTLENQWFLQILGRKAHAAGYGVVMFDWRGHGKSADRSPTLTSDGLWEGRDFVRIAAEAKQLGCPAPFWFVGYSLGGQLALWGVDYAAHVADWGPDLGDRLTDTDLAGGIAICPSLDSTRSLRFLASTPIGRYMEHTITRQLQHLAQRLHRNFPDDFDPEAIARAESIWGFDRELVIPRLGFASVEAYYAASAALPLLDRLTKPTLVLYAQDDPMFDPALGPELAAAGDRNAWLDVLLTQHGGHVGYISSAACQARSGDRDPWWAWNRVLDWLNHQDQRQVDPRRSPLP
jgi:predicted alpha/beta-fold hydrolase